MPVGTKMATRRSTRDSVAKRRRPTDVDTRLLRSIQVRNLLSFGPDTPEFELENLNVLIGANGSGKSNFIEVMHLLQSLPRDFEAPFTLGGNVENWIWKSQEAESDSDSSTPQPHAASIHAYVNPRFLNLPTASDRGALRYHMEFSYDRHSYPVIRDESLSLVCARADNQRGRTSYTVTPPPYFHRLNRDQYEVHESPTGTRDRKNRRIINREGIPTTQSFLYLQQASTENSVTAEVARLFERIKIYREWSFGQSSILRRRQHSDERSDQLEFNLSNLNLILGRTKLKPKLHDRLLRELRHYAGDVTDYSVVAQSGKFELFFREGNVTIPAARLSDGALRFLCLLIILCDPAPPPLICIETPELGLHADVLPALTSLMEDIATRTQLIVTTHSHTIVDALSHRPGSVIVCEKVNGRTVLERVNINNVLKLVEQEDVDEGLASLWESGVIGGTR